MKNLLILHLESISQLTLAIHRQHFPNLDRLLSESLRYENYFSSATSTRMVQTHLFHGNDFELDQFATYSDAVAAGNCEHLFAILKAHGYRPGLACLNMYHNQVPAKFSVWPRSISTPFCSADPEAVMAELDRMIDERPFAVFFWNLITHIEHSGVYAHQASSLTHRLQNAYRKADEMIGELLQRLQDKGALADTLIVVYGDHGDDFWGHGFKGGMVHGLEPYANMVWTPLAIWSGGNNGGIDNRLASTIDIRATCLDMLGIEHHDHFPFAGKSLLTNGQSHIYSQNFMANQPDSPQLNIARAIAVYNDTYCLLVSSRGLEMFAYRLDPMNRCNLLHFHELTPDGGLRLLEIPGARSHYLSAIPEGEAISNSISRNFTELRGKLSERIIAKRTYLNEKLPGGQISTWPPDILSRIEKTGWNVFFNVQTSAPTRPSYRLY
ncbi:MAG: Sulfatase [Candidatus Nitrotoga sp. SPKER]|nr:MAG: Sulfatase [Candidatus Nitrotoga sp. SPKER]